jgi:heme exporter protein A
MISAPPSDLEAAGQAAAIEISGLRVVLGDQPVLRGVDLTVARGARLALVGPNGAGKSTLLRVVAGLIRPATGEVRVDGTSLAHDPWQARRATGLVGHQPILHPDLTARENLRFYADLYGLDAVRERVEAALHRFGLGGRADTRAATLSRGLLQRLALARTLLHDPTVLLLDEAETGLDARAQEWLHAALLDRREQRTVLLASHDLGYVAQVADEVAFIRAGRLVGRLQTSGLNADDLRERYVDVHAARPAEQARRSVGVAG